MVILAMGSLVLMALLDFATGQELVFSCAYLIPVSLTAWHFRRRWMVAMAIASGLTAFTVDRLDGYAYSHPGIEYWNAFACFVISVATGFILSRLKQTLEQRKEANEGLRAALEKLEASTIEIRRLQSGLQTVCAWTKRIKVGDQWMTADEFLTTQLHLELSHGISPEAYKNFTAGFPPPLRPLPPAPAHGPRHAPQSLSLGSLPTATQVADAGLGDLIEAVFRRHRRRYGYRRLAEELADRGVTCASSRIRRLMAQRGLRAIQPKTFVPKTSDGRADKPSPNLLSGQPLPAVPNRVWAGDITFIPTSAGWLYLAVVTRLLSWMELSPRKYHQWRDRYGQANEHNGLVPRDHWIEPEERAAIIAFAREYPLEGYRRLSFMMLDRDIAAVSPSTTYRVLRDAGLLQPWNAQPTKKGTGFVQPLEPHDHWHVDFSYLSRLVALVDRAEPFLAPSEWEAVAAWKKAVSA